MNLQMLKRFHAYGLLSTAHPAGTVEKASLGEHEHHGVPSTEDNSSPGMQTVGPNNALRPDAPQLEQQVQQCLLHLPVWLCGYKGHHRPRQSFLDPDHSGGSRKQPRSTHGRLPACRSRALHCRSCVWAARILDTDFQLPATTPPWTVWLAPHPTSSSAAPRLLLAPCHHQQGVRLA